MCQVFRYLPIHLSQIHNLLQNTLLTDEDDLMIQILLTYNYNTYMYNRYNSILTINNPSGNHSSLNNI